MSEAFLKLPQRVIAIPANSLGSTAKLVYAAIVDRIGQNGDAWPGERRIAADIGSTRQAVNRALVDLEGLGLLIVERGQGPRGTNRYRLPTGAETMPVADQGVTRNVTTGGAVSLHRPVLFRGHNQTKEPDPTTRPTLAPDVAEPMLIPGVAQDSPPKGKRPRPFTDDDLERIYRAYPRHVAKAAAHKAIRKAAEAVAARGEPDPAAWLLAKTQEYAAAVAAWPAEDRRFIPHPATWFGQARYDDDSAEWQRGCAGGRVTHNAAHVVAPAGKYDGIMEVC